MIYPNGTEVVLVDGSVGKILSHDEFSGTYNIHTSAGLRQLPSESVTPRKRISKDAIDRNLGVQLDYTNFREFTIPIFTATVGSVAFGLSNDDSDIDKRTIFVARPILLHSLAECPNTIDDQIHSFTAWEIRHFIQMALRSNPNVLEALESPLWNREVPGAFSDFATILHKNAWRFLSKMVFQTYIGYVNSQFKKLEGDIRNKGAIKNKHAMHLIRLLISGITLLKERRVLVNVDEYRNELLSIKNGDYDWDGIVELKSQYMKRIEWAYGVTTLPDYPDYQWAERLCILIRQEAMKWEW